MTEIVASKNFEDRLKDRIKDSIGELMSDDGLKKIVERGMDETLFRPRVVSKERDRFGYAQTESKPPLVQEIIEPLLRERCGAAVTAWLTEHPEIVEAAIKESIGKGVCDAVGKAIDQRLWSAFGAFDQALRQGLLPNGLAR